MNSKRGYLSFIAVFLSCLIMTIPFYSASVFAGFDNVEAKGSDGVDDYIRENDYIDFEVLVNVDGDTDVKKEQVKLAPSTSFSSCSAALDGFECSLKYPSSGKTDFEDSVSYTLKLYDDSSDEVDSYTGALTVDNLPPSVKSFSMISEGGGVIKLDYSVEDYAYNSGDTSKCSGILGIEFRKDSLSGSVLKTLDLETSDCTASGSTTYSYSGSGVLKVCAKVYDNFNQDSTEEACDEIDTTPPAISSLEIVDSNGDTVYYIGKEGSTVSIKVAVGASGLDTSSIKANLSGLGLGDSVAPDSIETVDDDVVATWSNVKISEDKTSIKVDVKTSNENGFETVKTFSKTLGIDSTAPVVEALQTGKVYGGESYAKSAGNNFIAYIAEDDSGLNPADVKLHVSSLTVSADNCTGGWVCYWNNVDVDFAQDLKAYIGSDSKDKVGNYFEEAFVANISVDNDAPVIDDESIEIISDHPLGYVATGYGMTVRMNITDSSPVIYAYADLSDAISSMDNATGNCFKENSTFICEWAGEVDAGKKDVEINIKACDIVENCAEAAETIKVYGVSEETPDFYRLILNEDYITALDKQVADHFVSDYIYYLLPFTLDYESGCNGDIGISNVKLTGADCSGGSYASYNQAGDNYNGFFQFAIDPYDVEIEEGSSSGSLTVGANGCALEFNVVCNDNVYSESEKENITFSIPVVDTLAVDDSLIEEIEDVKDTANNGLWKTIETLDKIVLMLQNICQIKNFLGNVKALIVIIGSMFSGCMNIPIVGQLICAPAEKSAGATQGGLSGIVNTLTTIVNTMCSLVMCTNQSKTKYMGNPLKLFASGAFCDALRDWFIGVIPEGKVGSPIAGLTKAGWPSTLELAQKSYIFSIGCFCIPGIIYNLKKLQEIECWKAYCYQKMVPAGLPKEECDKQYGYQVCVYWTGQLTVFLDILAAPLKAIMNLIANPIAGVWTIARIVLDKECTVSALTCADSVTCGLAWKGPCFFANSMLLIETSTQIMQFVETLGQMQWTPQMNFCDQLD